MDKFLIVVDMQNDFIEGSLGTGEAKAIVPGVRDKVRECLEKGYRVIFTRDTHTEEYLLTQEGKNLPVKHCIKNTWGWELCDLLKEYAAPENIYDKETFGSVLLAGEIKQAEPVLIELIGLCTDICVISNALILKAFMPETKITVFRNLCAGVTPESHKNALEAMKMCQIVIE